VGTQDGRIGGFPDFAGRGYPSQKAGQAFEGDILDAVAVFMVPSAVGDGVERHFRGGKEARPFSIASRTRRPGLPLAASNTLGEFGQLVPGGRFAE